MKRLLTALVATSAASLLGGCSAPPSNGAKAEKAENVASSSQALAFDKFGFMQQSGHWCVLTNGFGNAVQAGNCQPNLNFLLEFDAGTNFIRTEDGNCLTEQFPWSNNSPVIESSCANDINQLWTPRVNGAYQSSGSGKCLDVDDYGNVTTQPCSQQTSQFFSFFQIPSNGFDNLWPWTWSYVPFTIAAYWPALPNPSLVVDVNSDSRNPGTGVDIYPYNGGPAQFWWYDPGTREIHLTDSNGMCLQTPPNAPTQNGTPVQIDYCNGGTNQQWTFNGVRNGSSNIVNVAQNRCLDVPGWSTTPSTFLWVWDCWGGANQQFFGPYDSF